MDLLCLDGYFPREVEELDDAIIIEAIPDDQPDPTCTCDAPKVVKHGKREVRFKDTPVRRKPTFLRIVRQRFRCQNCKTLLLHDLPGIDAKRLMTERFRDQIAKDAAARTFADAAGINGVDESLARRIFKDHADKRLKRYTFDLPRVLGMDEKYIQGAARFVIGDVEARRMLDMQPSRKNADLEAYFGQFDINDRAKVEVITQDMYWGYKTVNERYFRNATIVIDKFHVVRYANLAVEIVRKSIQKNLDNDGRISLKHKIRLLSARPHNLDHHGRWQLRRLLADHPMLDLAITCKEWFYDIYECQTRAEAEAAYKAWVELLPPEMERPFMPILRFMKEKRWRPLIFNYFDHPYTNAYVEGLNGLIDQINRSGRGMDLATLRAKALLRYGNLIPMIDKYTFNIRLGDPMEEVIMETEIGHGIDLSTFEDAVRREAFW